MESRQFVTSCFRRISIASGYLAVIVGLLVLAGWIFNIPVLKGLRPDHETMKANTAVLFIVSGLSVIFWQIRNATLLTLSRWLALVVLVIGALTLGEYIWPYGWSLDNLLIQDLGATAYPGRMSPITASLFAILGTALVLNSFSRAWVIWPAQGLSIVALATSLLALLGYIFDVSQLYKIGTLTTIAQLTTLTFVSLSLGVLCMKPDKGLMKSAAMPFSGGRLLRRQLPFVLLTFLFVSLLSQKGGQLGWFDPQFSIVVMVTTCIFVFSTGIWLTASCMNRSDEFKRRALDAYLEKEIEVAEHSAQLTAFVEHMPNAVAMFDRQMRYLQVSRRWIENYGLENKRIIGRSHYEVFPDIPERWKRIHERCLAGETLRCDFDRYDRSDGMVVTLRWEVRPWYNHRGEIGGIMMFCENIRRFAQSSESPLTLEEACNRGSQFNL